MTVTLSIALIALALSLLGTIIIYTWRSSSLTTTLTLTLKSVQEEAKRQSDAMREEMKRIREDSDSELERLEKALESVNNIPLMKMQLDQQEQFQKRMLSDITNLRLDVNSIKAVRSWSGGDFDKGNK